MAKTNAKGRSKGDGKHVRFYEWELASPAFRSLSCQARCLLLEIKRRHNGKNNGDISLSVREAAMLLEVGKNTSQKCFVELQEKGFIRPAQKGSFDYKQRHATRWILTMEKVGDAVSTKEFMSWKDGGRKKTTVPLTGTPGPSQGDREALTVPLRRTDGPSQGDREAIKAHPDGPSQGDSLQYTIGGCAAPYAQQPPYGPADPPCESANGEAEKLRRMGNGGGPVVNGRG